MNVQWLAKRDVDSTCIYNNDRYLRENIKFFVEFLYYEHDSERFIASYLANDRTFGYIWISPVPKNVIDGTDNNLNKSYQA